MGQPSHRFSVLNRFRQHPRVCISAPFVCTLSQYQSRHWLKSPGIDLGVVYDLSIRGARVSTEAEIRPGDEVTLSLRLPKQIKPADIAVATVQWAKDQFFGLIFTEVSPGCTESPQKVRGDRFNDCRVASRSFVIIFTAAGSIHLSFSIKQRRNEARLRADNRIFARLQE